MASLTQFAKLENTDEVQRGIYETIITHDALMPLLQFVSFEGNAYAYNRELALPTAFVHAAGSTVSTTNPTFTRRTCALTTVMAQTELDLYIKETRGKAQDPEAVNMMLLAKALTREISRQVIQGDSGNSDGEGQQGEEFEGLTSLLVAESRWLGMDDLTASLSSAPGSAETTLTQDGLDTLIDNLDDARTPPDALIMNTTMRRKISSLSRASGSGIQLDSADMFGHQYTLYNGVPIVITNFVTDSEQYEASGTWPSSTATSIIAMHFGEGKQGHALIHNGPVLQPRVMELPVPKDEHSQYQRMYVYTNALVYSPLHIVGLGGIDSAT